MEKKEMLHRIQERDIEFKLKEDLFTLLEENIERIEYVTDHVGVRDFLFIAEKGTNYAADFFTAIDVDCDSTYDFSKNLEEFKKKCIDQPLKSFAELVTFFEKTERMLYIGVGFTESQLTEEDEKKILRDFRGGLIKSYEEGARKYRNFPKWYKAFALEPEKINYISKKAETMINVHLKKAEENKLRQEIDKILDKKTITQKDKESLQSLSEQLKELLGNCTIN